MTVAEWIEAANKLLKANPNLTYKQSEQQLAADGHKRPPGITQKGGSKGLRWGLKSKRTPRQNAGRKTQEQTSTPLADYENKLLAKQRAELQGIAEFAGMPTPHREHPYSQDISGLLQTGAPSDFIKNVPSDLAAVKTALEQRIRTRYNNRYAVGVGVNGLRVIPVEFFDELVNPDDLPGIDIDETVPIDDQINVLKSIYTPEPPRQLGGFQTHTPSITTTAGTVKYKPKQVLSFPKQNQLPQTLPPEPKQDLTQQVYETYKVANTAVTTAKVLRTGFAIGTSLLQGIGGTIKFVTGGGF